MWETRENRVFVDKKDRGVFDKKRGPPRECVMTAIGRPVPNTTRTQISHKLIVRLVAVCANVDTCNSNFDS